MATLNQKIKEAKKIYEIYWDSYTKGDLETFALEIKEGKGSRFRIQNSIDTANK